MSVVKPTIDELLSACDENRYLLCEMAARRARDINDMMRNQYSRAELLGDVEDVSVFMSDEEGHVPNPLSIAFNEIAPRTDEFGQTVAGDLGYDRRALDTSLGCARKDAVCEEEPAPVDADEEQAAEEPVCECCEEDAAAVVAQSAE